MPEFTGGIDNSAYVEEELREKAEKDRIREEIFKRMQQCRFTDEKFTKEPAPLNEYDRGCQLGKGVFGSTFRMKNIRNELYAVKEIDVKASEDYGIGRDRLLQEAGMLQKPYKYCQVLWVFFQYPRNFVSCCDGTC